MPNGKPGDHPVNDILNKGVRTWLKAQGLERYADAFEENEVTVEDLPDLTPADLKDDLGVKKGPFYVLFLSTMPAVLVEAGFVTNKAEARRLRDDAYREAMAEQIAEALERYRDSGATLALGRLQ